MHQGVVDHVNHSVGKVGLANCVLENTKRAASWMGNGKFSVALRAMALPIQGGAAHASIWELLEQSKQREDTIHTGTGLEEVLRL